MSQIYGLLVAFAAGVGGLLFGYEIGVIGQVMNMDPAKLHFGYANTNATGHVNDCKSIDVDAGCYRTKSDTESWITSSFLIGCIFGALLVSILADKIGRKWSILVGGSLFTIGGIAQTAAPTIDWFYAARVISGFGVGIMSMSVPLYLSETSPANVRGRNTTIYQLMITIGIFISTVIDSIFIAVTSGEFQWRGALAVQVVPGIILVVIMVFMPYSPRWLADRDRDSETLTVLARLRGTTMSAPSTQEEFRAIKADVEFERQIGNATWSECMRPGIINRLAIALILQFFQQWSGINVVMYYQVNLFKALGLDGQQSTVIFPIINTFVNVIFTFPGMYLVERIGRRKLLLFGAAGMAISLYAVPAFFSLSQSTGITGLGWLALCFIFVFIAFFSSTWGPIVWVYQSEIFPLRVRAKGTGCGTMSNWTWNAIVANLQPRLADAISGNTYYIYGTAMICAVAYTYFFVPETMGKSLEEMDDLFGAPDDAKRRDVEIAAKESK